MDVVNAQIQSQTSICSESTSDEAPKITVPSNLEKRICLVGELQKDSRLRAVAETFGVPVVTSETGKEYADDDSCTTVFVVESFDGDIFTNLTKSRQCLLGPPALQQLANKKDPLPNNTRPLYNLAMSGVVVCLTGFKVKEEVAKLVPLIHHMGGSIRKDVSGKVTHLIANVCGGEKYLYATTFKVPILNLNWVYASWDRRDDLEFSATQDTFVAENKLKPFHGAKVCFLGFPEEEENHMTEVLLQNGGTISKIDDPTCTHVVMDRTEVYTLEPTSGVLSPKITSPQQIISPKTPINPNPSSTFVQQTAKSNCNINNFFSKANQSCLETLRETSRDGTFIDTDSIYFDRSFDLINQTHIGHRKRKFDSPDQPSVLVKRKRDKSYSEKKKKVTEFFKTPINYFSNRRRTIDTSNFSQSMNESVLSSSGIFNVETVQNLTCYNDHTPKGVQKKSKKNLFTRTFSSSKFLRSKGKKNVDLNATRLSFSEAEGVPNMNASCFPDISFQILPKPSESNSDMHRAIGRPTAYAVVDESSRPERPEVPKAWVVKAEWFWTSVQKVVSVQESEYVFEDLSDNVLLSPNTRRDSHIATPSSQSRRKRKRLQNEILSTLAHQSPSLHKRRSSVSDAGLLSVSGSFLDCTTSPDKQNLDGTALVVPETPKKPLTARHQVFLELVQTEKNYVGILETILNLFKKELEEMSEDTALLNNTELNLIFGKLPVIYETHSLMFKEFEQYLNNWNEEAKIGDTIVKFSSNLQKAYPPFINYFEEMKEMITLCDIKYPRFHAFLKAKLSKPECGRQSLQELMIRPVQRLGSISLLLNDILKHTSKSNPDHASLVQSLEALREVMTHINEDKRKAEGQVTLFNIFNDIDNCPPDIVSSHRHFIAKAEVVQLNGEGLASKGNNLVLFLFSDQLEVCKKKSKSFNSLKSPSGGSLQNRTLAKPYKHVKLMALNTIKCVVDVKESEQCQNVFSLVCRSNDEVKERLYSFQMADEEADKTSFLKTLTREMANNACTADADKFMAYLEPQQLDIDTSDLNNGTLSKAFKFATRTRLKVGRAFSFNKTPSKLKRAVSSMMSPFGSSTNLTPSSQLAQMRLASCNNINELGNPENNDEESPPVAPMSVQPTRKMKTSSLGVNTLKRL